MDKLFDLLDNMSIIKAFKKCSEGLFLIAFVIVIFFYAMEVSQFSENFTIHMQPIFDLLPAILIFFKIVFTEYREWKKWPFYILAFAFGLTVAHASCDDFLYSTILLLIGANHVSFEKILKVYCIVIGGILISALVCSLTGVISNTRYLQDERGYRYSLGMKYPTDCSAYYLFWFISFIYAFRTRLKWWSGFFGIALSIILWFATKARNNCACLFLFAFIFILFKLKDSGYLKVKLPVWIKTAYQKICQYSVFVLAVVMIAGSIFVEKLSFVSSFVPGTFWARFTLGMKGMVRYDIKLFGQPTEYNFVTDYFFLDSSYHQLLIVFGIIALFVVIFAYLYLGDKFRNDKYMLLLLLVIALQSTMEFHLVDPSYNSIILALTAATGTTITVKNSFKSVN